MTRLAASPIQIPAPGWYLLDRSARALKTRATAMAVKPVRECEATTPTAITLDDIGRPGPKPSPVTRRQKKGKCEPQPQVQLGGQRAMTDEGAAGVPARPRRRGAHPVDLAVP